MLAPNPCIMGSVPFQFRFGKGARTRGYFIVSPVLIVDVKSKCVYYFCIRLKNLSQFTETGLFMIAQSSKTTGSMSEASYMQEYIPCR